LVAIKDNSVCFGDRPFCCSISDRRLDGFEVKQIGRIVIWYSEKLAII